MKNELIYRINKIGESRRVAGLSVVMMIFAAVVSLAAICVDKNCSFARGCDPPGGLADFISFAVIFPPLGLLIASILIALMCGISTYLTSWSTKDTQTIQRLQNLTDDQIANLIERVAWRLNSSLEKFIESGQMQDKLDDLGY